ncbi:O-antigen translocase [Flavobacterium sp. GT2N3]|uniref:O-antigen translocase n=1 Tax=unclassified Flavobacterium TaxID=196869 RepID=UPI003AB05639
MSENNQESKDALKSTGVVGGGQVINIAIGLVRTKVIAVILGPSGVGIIGLLNTASDMVRNVTTIGIPFSGVRDISIASSSEIENAVPRVVSVFLKWITYFSVLGSLVMVLFCMPLSNFMFGNTNYALSIGILSISVFFTSLSLGYNTILQGKRAIGLLVKSGIIANLISAAVTVGIYYFLKKDGIVLALVSTAIINCVVSYIYFKKLKINKLPNITLKESWPEAKAMIQLGFFTIVVSVFDQMLSLILRAFISDKAGVDGVGLFTAATTIATMYLTIVLSSLGSDYYPKLAAINSDNAALNKSVNAQLQIVLLLACPFIAGMVCFSELVIRVLYTKEFLKANEVLKWQVLGDFFKIIAWPCGYVILAKGLGKLYIGYSISYTLIYVGIIYFGWSILGFFGIGISFFVSQFLGLVFLYVYSYFKFNIQINAANQKVIATTSSLLIAAYVANTFFTAGVKIGLSFFVFAIMVIYSCIKLSAIISVKDLLQTIKFKFKK